MKRFRRVALTAQGFLARLSFLAKVESRLLAHDSSDSSLFILGAPRTGTTLVYQLLLKSFCFSYISNIASLFVTCPVLATRMAEPFRRRATITFDSRYGYVRGLFSPSEAGALMRSWFDEHARSVPLTIGSLNKVMGGPFLCKNLNNSLRIKEVVAILPDALFLWVKRNPMYTAQSILLARRDLSANQENDWFSVKPEEYDRIKTLSDVEQVVWQIKLIDDHIERSVNSLGLIERLHLIQYEDVCADPAGLLVGVERFLKDHDVFVEKRRITEMVPAGFLESKKQVLNDDEWAQLTEAVRSLYGKG